MRPTNYGWADRSRGYLDYTANLACHALHPLKACAARSAVPSSHEEDRMMLGVTDSYADDKKVLTATFPTQGGANLAVKTLQELEKQGLLDVENTITVNKNALDQIDVHETTGDSGRKGAGIGALVGGVLGLIFPPSILATTALGAAIGGMTGVLRGSNFDESEIKAMADSLQPGQSMLIAIVEPQWQDEVDAALDGMANKIGWAVMSAAQAKALAEHRTPS
jgi:uncharacterized membrane protein